jgi:hypothetical protein
MEAIFNSNNDDEFYEHILSCQNSLFLSSTILLSFSSFAIFPIFMDRGPIGSAARIVFSSPGSLGSLDRLFFVSYSLELYHEKNVITCL